MSGLPLIRNADPEAALAWSQGKPISRRRYLADVALLAEQLPATGHMLNLSTDRYRFAVGLGAALLRGQDNLLPPHHTPDMVARLELLFPGMYVIGDSSASSDSHRVRWPAPDRAIVGSAGRPFTIAPEVTAARVLTSGSTGNPLPYAKTWGLLWRNAEAGAARLAEHLGRADLDGVNLVATVPAQHMYGFESSLLAALLGGAAFDAGRPFYPVDIAAALARMPRPRMLVTTPLHLKALLDSQVPLPAIDLSVCATAPLSPQLAVRAEAALRAPLMEIYGCTEAGQVATRRTTQGAAWQTYAGLTVSGASQQPIVSGGHVPQPTPLADTLEIVDARHFHLLGRANDLINIAGKRSSLSHLNYHLNAVDGVQDGAFFLPPSPALQEDEVIRMMAFVVAPGVSREHIVGALRERIDAAFLPRRIVWVDALPRDATGKLPSTRLATLAAQAPGPLDPAPLD